MDNQSTSKLAGQPAVSIVIPAYNVEKYLARCLYSLININISYEIIIINDDSKDNTLSIAKDFQQRFSDKTIKIISQPHKGVSAARNLGLASSRGNYIYFMDSDDFLDPINFTSLVQQAIQQNLDIGIGRFYYFNHAEKQVMGEMREELFHYPISQGIEVIDACRVEVWLKIFRRDFLLVQNIQFIANILFEDEIFHLHTMLFAQRVKYIDIPFYFYYQRKDSLSHSISDKQRYQNYYRLVNELEKLRQKVTNKQAENIIYLRMWAFLREALPKCYFLDPIQFEQRRQRLMPLFSHLAKLETLPAEEKRVIDLLLSTEKVKFSIVEQ